MSCNCNHEQPKKEEKCRRPHDSKGVVKFCDLCDPCEENVSNVKLCAFVVPTLEEGRYYKNSFIFVEEDDSVYYISDDRSEIPFGSRPKFIEDFDPTDPTVDFKNTVVYDVKNAAAYIYDPEGNMVASGLTPRPISSILAGEGILVDSQGGEYTISADYTTIATKESVDDLTVIVGGHTESISDLENAQAATTRDLNSLSDLVDRVHNTADEANERAVLARAEAAAAEHDANAALAALPGKQDKLTPGDNVTIQNNVISAVDTTYTAGSGLNLNGTQFSVDTTEIQPILTFDQTPTANSTNPVTSEGIKNYVDEKSITFKPFPASVQTSGTTQQFMDSILALNPETGMAYLGTVTLSDMPGDLLQEEVEVYVYSDYVVYCIMRSTDVAPYAWWCASYNYQGWLPMDTDTTYTAGTNVSISNENVISAVDTTYSAGANISIDANNEISATDTTYTAGNGLSLSGTEFSVDNSVVAFQTDLPTVNDATLTIQKNSTDVGTFTANASSNSTINITVPTTAAGVSALPDSTKYGASISLTIDSSTYVVTAQLKDQDGNNLGSSQTIDLPLESVVVSGSYDSQTKEVVLTLQGGSTIRFSVADLVSGLQSEITSQSPLDADLVDDSTSTNKFVTSSDITAWNGKQDTIVAGSNIQIAADGVTISATDTTYSAGTNVQINGTTISATDTTYTAGTNVQINGTVISATDTTYSDFAGATAQDAGAAGLVPAPAAGDEGKFLSGNGLWTTVSQYSLPIASANDLGGIKVGTNLSIDSTTGVLSATDTTYSAGTNVQINGTTISATDTTYSNFTGTDGTTAGAAGLVPAPATTDAGKFLKADGTWDTAGGDSMIKLTTADYNWNHNTGTETDPTSVAIWKLAPGVYYRDKDDQVIVCTGKFGALGQEHYVFIVGASYTDSNSKEQKPFTVLKENNSGLVNAIATSYVFNVTDLTGVSVDYLSNYSIYNSGLRDRVQIGSGASSTKNSNVAIGASASSTGNRATAVGRDAVASADGAVAIGSYSSATVVGQVDVGSTHTSDGYNSSNYRLLTGLYDGQSAHDAATKGQLDAIAIQNAGAPTTATVGTVGQILEDTTNGKLYICTDATNPYVWEEVGTGGGGNAISAADWAALWAGTIENINGVGV